MVAKGGSKYCAFSAQSFSQGILYGGWEKIQKRSDLGIPIYKLHLICNHIFNGAISDIPGLTVSDLKYLTNKKIMY